MITDALYSFLNHERPCFSNTLNTFVTYKGNSGDTSTALFAFLTLYALDCISYPLFICFKVPSTSVGFLMTLFSTFLLFLH